MASDAIKPFRATYSYNNNKQKKQYNNTRILEKVRQER